jgi:hypothetical protein
MARRSIDRTNARVRGIGRGHAPSCTTSEEFRGRLRRLEHQPAAGFLVAALVAWLAFAGSPAAQASRTPPVLGIAAEQFTVDGKPRFLTVISYFDALRAEALTADLDFIRRDLGFDGIRVFPNWWGYDRKAQPCPASRDDTLFDAQGNIRGDGATVSGPLARLHALLRETRARGLVVDLSFARETVQGGMTVDAYQRGLQRTAFLLREYRHVLFDLQNERDLDRPAMHLAPPQVRALRDAVRDPERGDPRRLVVASTTGSSPPIVGDEVNPAGTVGFVKTAGLDAVAFHDPRGAGWETRVPAVVGALRRAGKPVYLQEPSRWRVADTSACGRPETADSDGDAGHFRLALKHARDAGAAAWTFHTQRTFALGPGRPSLRAQVLGLPRGSAERVLLLGDDTSPRLTGASRPGITRP